MKITLTKEQWQTLKRFLEYEIDQEYTYQYNGDCDSEYLTSLVDLYEAIHVGCADSWIQAYAFQSIIDSYKKNINELDFLKDCYEKERQKNESKNY